MQFPLLIRMVSWFNAGNSEQEPESSQSNHADYFSPFISYVRDETNLAFRISIESIIEFNDN